MSNQHDDDGGDGGDGEREAPPAVSRLERTGERRYRVLNRAPSRPRSRSRFQRLRKQIPIAELIGRLIEHHGITDEVRRRAVCIYWLEIAGERIASKTFPVGLADGVLQVSAINSSWVHELRFFKAQLIEQVNRWVDANQIWLGPPPLVHDMRFALAMRQRERLVDRDHLGRLRRDHARRVRPRSERTPAVASEAERQAIRAETCSIADAELRALIEGVRLKWNR
jgi:hypothetical protein